MLQEYENKILHADCMDILKELPDKSIDLVLTDPPYLYRNIKAGTDSKLSKQITRAFQELETLKDGVSLEFCEEIMRIQNKINAYIWCSKDQIISYLDFFVTKNGCSFDILCWYKNNAMPTYNNKYLTDKEFCLYFRKGGYCMPQDYEHAKTIFYEPINITDKAKFKHPTIKPLKIFEILIKNSSQKNDLVLDCFSGSGTTAVACHNLKRRFICIERDIDYYNASVERLKIAQAQLKLF